MELNQNNVENTTNNDNLKNLKTDADNNLKEAATTDTVPDVLQSNASDDTVNGNSQNDDGVESLSEESEAMYMSESDPELECSDDEVMDMLMARIQSRTKEPPELPDTVNMIPTPSGGAVYIVGTAHFSTQSQEDVAKVIQYVKPDVIVLELCKSRLSILQLDEKTILEESKNLNFAKMRETINQSGLMHGIMYLMLLSISANITKSLGMAPGGEFRRAVIEAHSIPGCQIHLGDRPIQITMQRALSSLTWCQSLRLMWQLLFNQESITVEDVERCKQKDLLKEMLVEMTGDYPALSNVFVNERDIYLTHSIQNAAAPITTSSGKQIGSVVVAVVGIGHAQGIIDHWNKVSRADIAPIVMIPKKSLAGRIFKATFKYSMYGLVIYGIYKAVPGSFKNYITSLASKIHI